MMMIGILSLALLMSNAAMAQNSFPTAGGATAGGFVLMCVVAGKAVPCGGTVTSGPDGSFPTPGGATADGAVRMCVISGVAVPC
jgi:hypothetical protein